MRRILALGMALLAPLFSFASTNEIVTVNGYEVHLIDTEKGSQFLVEYMVPYGNKNDSTQFAGRAHFLEHLILKGSLRFPGYSTLSDEAARMRAQKNAFTGPGYTGFYMVSQEEQADRAMDLMLAGLGGLEFSAETMKAELTAVDNEVNVEIPSKPFMRVLNGVFSEVLPEGHPLQRYDLGSTETLEALSVNDMKELYYGIYQPENVKVLVAANFKHGSLSREQVIAQLEKTLVPFKVEKDPHGYKPAASFENSSQLTSVVPADGSLQPFVEMKTLDNSRLSAHVLEVDLSATPLNPLALEIASGYLNSEAPGSLAQHLKSQGLITELNFVPVTSGDKLYFFVATYHTQEGWPQRDETLESLYESVAGMLHNLNAESLETIKASIVYGKRKAYQAPGAIVNDFMKLAQSSDPSYRALDFESAYSQVTAQEVQAVLRTVFQPRRSLNFAIAPEVEGDEKSGYFQVSPGKKDQVPEFLPLRRFDNSELIAELERTLALDAAKLPNRNPVFPAVELETTRTEPLDRANTSWKRVSPKDDPVVAFLKEKHDSREAAFEFEVKLAMQGNFAAQMAFSIYMSAFQERMVGLQSVLRDHDVTMSAKFSGFDLTWVGSSENPEALVQAFDLMVSEFRKFEMTEEEFDRFKREITKATETHISNGFLGGLVISEASDMFKGEVTNLQVAAVLEDLSYEQALEEVQALHFSKEPVMFALGDLSPEDMGKMLDDAWYSLGFTKAQPTRLVPSQAPAEISNTEHLQAPLPAGKSKNAAGMARVFSGPMLETPTEVALANLVGAHVQTATFNINRSEKGLGYVHGAALGAVNRQSLLYFYGQVEHVDRIVEAEDGWEQVIEQLRSGEVDQNTWAEYQAGLLAQLNSKPGSQLAELSRVLNDYQARGDLHWRKKMIKAIEEFDPQAVPSFVEQFVAGSNFQQIEIRSCARELGSSSKSK